MQESVRSHDRYSYAPYFPKNVCGSVETPGLGAVV